MSTTTSSLVSLTMTPKSCKVIQFEDESFMWKVQRIVLAHSCIEEYDVYHSNANNICKTESAQRCGLFFVSQTF